MTRVTLPLVGGLGNQLFQLQAALSLFEGEIELVGNIGRPRTTDGLPDICHGRLPSRVIYKERKKNRLIEKVHSYVLRTSLQGDSRRYKVALITFLSSIVFSFYLLRPVRVRAANDLGFCEMGKIKRNTVLIGYFQSYRWSNSEIGQVLFKEWSESIQKLKSESESKSICILHIRLTDYLQESSFGLLDSRYYEDALDIVFANCKIDEIWLFSDDLALAKTILPSKYRERIRQIDDSGLLPIEILVGMSLGEAYVIANSTFSWWAARFSAAKMIIAPKPWFLSSKSPKDLIPVDWHELQLS